MNVNQGNALIQVKNLGKSFGDLKVLQGITVDIHQGDVVCVFLQYNYAGLHLLSYEMEVLGPWFQGK